MAYSYATGLAKNADDLFVKLKDAIVANGGWTMVDNEVTTGTTGQDLVIESTGEATDNLIRLHFVRQNTGGNVGVITCMAVQSYNTGTDASINEAGSTSGSLGTGTFIYAERFAPCQYWFFISKDRIIVLTRSPSRPGVTDTFYAGGYTRTRSANWATTTNAESAGTSVVVEVNNTTYFTVGKRYTLMDDTNIEYPKVTAINPGVSVTLDELQNNFTSSARLGEDPRPVIVLASTTGFGIGSLSHWVQAPPYRGGANLASSATLGSAVREVSGSFGIRVPDQSLIERTGPDFGPDGIGPGVFNLWPFFVTDESHMGGGLLGALTEVFITTRDDIATDDAITVGGATYHYINTASMITGSGSTAIGAAIRRA